MRAWGTQTAVTNLPDDVAALTNVTQVAASGFGGDAFALAGGHLYHWGVGTLASNVPAALDSKTVTQLSISYGTGSAVTSDDGVYAWTSVDDSGFAAPEANVSSIAGLAAGYSNTTQSLALLTSYHAVTKPTLSNTSPTVGSVLTATDATFSLTGGTVTGQWFRGDTAIEGATGTTYTVADADINAQLSYKSTAVLNNETASSQSDKTKAVPGAAASLSLTAAAASYGRAAAVTAKVASTGSVSGTVVFKVDGKPAGTGNLVAGSARVNLPASLAAGAHTVTATYAGNSSVSAANGSLRVNVAQATSTAKVVLPKKAKKGKKAKISVSIVASGGVATGKVTVTVGKSKATGTLSGGKASVTIKLKKKGKQKVTVVYGGDRNVRGSRASGSLKVK